MPFHRFLAAAAFALALSAPAAAQDAETPYWASLRADEVNMRVGPSEEYRISWVYRRVQLPLKVIRLKEGWRLVEDHEGTRGWMMARFLTRDRGAVVTGAGLAEMRAQASASAPLKWRLEPGVVGRLGECDAGWCRLGLGARSGYVREDRLWGEGKP